MKFNLRIGLLFIGLSLFISPLSYGGDCGDGIGDVDFCQFEVASRFYNAIEPKINFSNLDRPMTCYTNRFILTGSFDKKGIYLLKKYSANLRIRQLYSKVDPTLPAKTVAFIDYGRGRWFESENSLIYEKFVEAKPTRNDGLDYRPSGSHLDYLPAHQEVSTQVLESDGRLVAHFYYEEGDGVGGIYQWEADCLAAH